MNVRYSFATFAAAMTMTSGFAFAAPDEATASSVPFLTLKNMQACTATFGQELSDSLFIVEAAVGPVACLHFKRDYSKGANAHGEKSNDIFVFSFADFENRKNGDLVEKMSLSRDVFFNGDTKVSATVYEKSANGKGRYFVKIDEGGQVTKIKISPGTDAVALRPEDRIHMDGLAETARYALEAYDFVPRVN